MEVVFAQVATFLGATFVFFYGGIEANKRRDMVILGAQDGMPIDIGHRYLILINDWMPLKFGLSAIAAASTAAVLQMSPRSGLADLLAYELLIFGVGAFGCVFVLVYGLLDLIHCLKILRRIAARS